MIRRRLHTVPENLQEFLFNLFVTPGDSVFNKHINDNAETLASVTCNFLERFTPEVGDDRRLRSLRHSIPDLECLNHFHRR